MENTWLDTAEEKISELEYKEMEITLKKAYRDKGTATKVKEHPGPMRQ